MSDVSLVPKRVTGDSMEDRLTENAHDRILPARYLKRNKDGELIETQEELFERVAKNISVAEAVWTDDPVFITPHHIKPDHPRREDLIDEVFGELDENDYAEAELTEENAKWVNYDRLVETLREADRDEALEAVVETRERFQDHMEKLSFTPNSPTLMNAGNELQQLSACFVVSPYDDISEIHDTARQAAEVFQSGGGMGYGFWRLRPYGDPVGSTGGIASGPITFMRTYDQMCETIAQGGKRRGAQMGIMRVSHPDVIFFLHAKNKDVSLARALRLNDPKDPEHTDFGEALEEARGLIDEDGKVPKHLRNAVEGHLSNFNISVGVTEEFMKAVQDGEDYTFKNPRSGEAHIATEKTKQMYSWFGLGHHVKPGDPLTLPAEEVWERILEGAHENGEPGVVFIDRINQRHSFPTESTPDRDTGEYEILATNPCGEQPLMEYEACNLGHINLSTLVEEDAPDWRDFDSDRGDMTAAVEEFLSEALRWDELDERTRAGTRFLDNVVTMSNFPIDKIGQTVANNRKIGLGIMGLAQMYIQMGVEYGSPAANEIARQVMTWINHTSKDESHKLAQKRGSFENWDDSKYADPIEYQEWFEHHVGRAAEEFEDGYPVRNHNTTTIAPTGTTSMIANTSGGCEPIPNVVYFKNVGQDIQGEEMLVEMDDYFRRVLAANDIDPEKVKQEAKRLMDNNEYQGVDNLKTVPDDIAELFITTGDLNGIEHGRVQCALQQGVDSAISKTINAPNEADLSDTREAFEYIWREGGKGVTYYRDGTRSKQVITTRQKNTEFSDDADPEELANEVLEEEVGMTLDEVKDDMDPENGHKARPRPKVTAGETHLIPTSSGKMYVTINEDEHGIHEVFVTIGKSGGFTESLCEALGRQISLSLRAGVDVKEVIGQLKNIRGPEVQWDQGEQIQSIPDGIATALERYIGEEAPEAAAQSAGKVVANGGQETQELASLIESGANPECPECGSMMSMKEGCQTCESCGFSKC